MSLRSPMRSPVDMNCQQKNSSLPRLHVFKEISTYSKAVNAQPAAVHRAVTEKVNSSEQKSMSDKQAKP